MGTLHAGSFPDPRQPKSMFGSEGISGDINNLLNLVVPNAGNYREGAYKAAPQLSLKEQQELSILKKRVISALDQNNDPTGIVRRVVRYAVQQLSTIDEVSTLQSLLLNEITTRNELIARVLAVCQFQSANISLRPSVAGTVTTYAKVLAELLSNESGTQLSVYKGLFNQWVKYFDTPPTWAGYLPLLSKLYSHEARSIDQQSPAIDLMSHSEDLVKACAKHPFIWTTIEKVHASLDEYQKVGFDLPTALSTYLQLFDAWDAQVESVEQQHQETQSFISRYLKIPSEFPNQLESIAKSIQVIAYGEPSYTVMKLFQELILTCRSDGNDSFIPSAASLVAQLIQAKLASHQEKQLLTLVERGVLRTPEDISDALKKWRTLRIMEGIALRNPLRKSDMKELLAEHNDSSGEILSLKVVQRRLEHWEELDDIRRGFTARLASSKRSPSGEAPEIVQCARDIGEAKAVRYLNVKDNNSFPGKGFHITQLDFGKTFKKYENADERELTPDLEDQKPFALYKEAWPDFAEAIDDIGKAEFVFLRGLIIISGKGDKYTLTLNSGKKVHYSLVVFNDHFHNPFQEVAYLIPNHALAKLFKGTQIGDGNYVGFDSRRPNLNNVIKSPQDLLQHPDIRGQAIDVGGVGTILSGFSSFLRENAVSHELRAIHPKEVQLDKDLHLYNKELQSLKFKSIAYKNSEIGKKKQLELDEQRTELKDRSDALAAYRAELFTDGEERIWKLVSRLIALHKVFLIQEASWQKGYSASPEINTDHVAELTAAQRAFYSNIPPREPGEIEFLKPGEQSRHKNRLRMLVRGYELHSKRFEGNPDPNEFFVLVPCNALKTGEQPQSDVYLDTWDMTVHIHGEVIQLSQGKMTLEDEIFWIHQFLPLVEDRPNKIIGLRFYPRSTLGLEFDSE